MRFKSSLPTLAGVAIMALALMLSITYNAHAQGTGGMHCDHTPCGGDSTVWTWQYPVQPFSVMVPINGCQFNNPPTCCTVTAKYRFRRSCVPATYQIEILHLSWDRDCGPSFDPVPMIRAVTFGLLAQNPMGFYPDLSKESDTGCNTNYSVQAAICWKNYPGAMKAAENCGADSAGYACCKGGYQVCRKVDPITGLPYREVTWLQQSTAVNNCINDPDDQLSCKPSCGAFNQDEIINRKKDDPPSLSMTPTHGADTATASTPPATIEPKTAPSPQRR